MGVARRLQQPYSTSKPEQAGVSVIPDTVSGIGYRFQGDDPDCLAGRTLGEVLTMPGILLECPGS